ncbi:hypothetical protein WA026_013656 [Henosepilachna vigintioctopunctata]|uniref:Uncharacterized protein n=1 Tax=Henosepilachna vigintioctopunctata TaxID=420089 RepID=A0AAW1UZ93_9CUCU
MRFYLKTKATSTFAPQDFSIGTDMGLGISWTNHQIPTSLAHASGLPHLAVSSSTTPPQSSSPVPIKTLNLAHSHHPRPNSAGQITPTPGSVTPTNLPSPSGPSSGDYESIQMHKRPRLSDWPS